MTLKTAYKKLGLTPLPEFIASRTADSDRRLGGTTWMLVEAAMAVAEGQDVAIEGRSVGHAQGLVKTCEEYAQQLNPLGPYGKIRAAGKFRRGFTDKVFNDLAYEEMARNKRKGPYAEIRVLERDLDGGYKAYNSRHEFLMDLTPEGGQELLDRETFRVSIR